MTNLDAPAFPLSFRVDDGQSRDWQVGYQSGMTKREHMWIEFAKAALPTLMASALASGAEQEVQAVPEAVCATANAMMAAIEAKDPTT